MTEKKWSDQFPPGVQQEIKRYMSYLGTKGGSAGKGDSKRRGDSEYYKAIRAKRTLKNKIKQAQEAAQDEAAKIQTG